MSVQNEMQEQVLGGRVSHFEPSNNRKCFKCEWSDSLKELGLSTGQLGIIVFSVVRKVLTLSGAGRLALRTSGLYSSGDITSRNTTP